MADIDDIPRLDFTVNETKDLYQRILSNNKYSTGRYYDFNLLTQIIKTDTGLNIHAIKNADSGPAWLTIFFEEESEKTLFMMRYL